MRSTQINGPIDEQKFTNTNEGISRHREFESPCEKNRNNKRFTFSLEKDKQNISNFKINNGFGHRSKSKQANQQEEIVSEAKLNPEIATKILGVLESENGHVPSTNIKTPCGHQGKNSGFKNEYFEDSHNKSRTAVGMNDLSHISPFSQKMQAFNFSATGASFKVGGNADGNNFYYHHNLSSLTKKSATKTTHKNSSSNQKDLSHPGYDVQSTTNVNPFSLPFKPETKVTHEEDFTIKPHLIYGAEKAQHDKKKPQIDQEHLEFYQHMEMVMHQEQQYYHYQYMQYQQYMESQRHHQNQQLMIRTCPVHGEGNQYKQTLEMMQAQAHAYAHSCFLYFQHMAKNAKSAEERAYYTHQQGVAGCMVHGPHGISPVAMPPIPSQYFCHQNHPQKQGGYPQNLPKQEEQNPVKHSEIPVPMQHQMTFGGLNQPNLVKNKNDEIIKSKDSDELKKEVFQCPRTVVKVNTQKDMYDDDNFPHNTTGDKNRKRQKLNPQVLLSETGQQEKVGQFLPDQQSFINGDNLNPGLQSGRSFHTTPQITKQISSEVMKDLPSQTDKKKRNRKNPNQMQYLMQEYQKDPTWSKETCQRVSISCGLTESQVYKWGWDQKNKKAEETNQAEQTNSQMIMQHLKKNTEIWKQQQAEKQNQLTSNVVNKQLDMMPMVYESPKSKHELAAETQEGENGKPIFAILSSKNFSNSCSDQKQICCEDKFENPKQEQQDDALNSNEQCQIQYSNQKQETDNQIHNLKSINQVIGQTVISDHELSNPKESQSLSTVEPNTSKKETPSTISQGMVTRSKLSTLEPKSNEKCKNSSQKLSLGKRAISDKENQSQMSNSGQKKRDIKKESKLQEELNQIELRPLRTRGADKQYNKQNLR